jgi:hypothetical protein
MRADNDERNVKVISTKDDLIEAWVRMTFERNSIPSSHSAWLAWLTLAKERGVRLDAQKIIAALGGPGP